MSRNRGVVYMRPGKVEVRDIDDPVLSAPDGRKLDHAVILKVITTNICGSDQHMVRGRTTAMPGLVLGHEITGEVIEKGSDVEMLEVGDIVSVPFNVACGRCRCCKSQDTGVCLTVNPSRAGGAYGYVDMGGWIGGQARYVMVPYADFNLLKFPDREQAIEKIRDLTMLSDILPTGFHGAVKAGVGVGSIVYVAGAGPVGLAAAASARILGAAVVMVGDFNKERLEHARKVGFEPIDLSASDRLGDMIAEVTGSNEVDSAIDAVGFEARGHSGGEQPAIVLNQMMEITRPAGSIGIPGLYVTEDPGAVDNAAKQGSLSLRFGLGWAKAQSFHTGQTPVVKYNRQLMQAILHGRLNIAEIVNAQVISLDDAPQGYESFDQGVAKKFVLDPHGMLTKAA
ncbi:formaldehyde dehydrogenase, glutathione-independent [Brucella pituitosa]|jgi:glutathione-independent formaldehyde dehydrogenase|uniref:Formaldehyde dehydrogenase, glutathione-independent n=1 Tax=Brucella pituitosa TaxID=571256 RepID=A0ABS3JXT1_9HYPH|nr:MULTISPECIES: formaldehyde dehydrogenase, glutathione-independent [Brucella]PQZ49071.1 formaldehyde dehydrogenase, glutathione-independent [Ochrobactrum sp. MYb19]PRA57724.1 formaldehyde dehydrogenase, glutathione-independent [Ochrobactrum sp. MYb68]PRA67110.1 formaldehyde dehydrogenase, glutathione-independent [Ochrobactrum sp. MYb18]PRA75859.1 formaldehyde dehydrogenase, glutathione-independent [Brucella thiophenivorans]PRA88857.1 formaldehyde dehydrogenase, glutathione-independent [Ochro